VGAASLVTPEHAQIHGPRAAAASVAVPDTLIGVLDQLGTFYSRQRVVLIWDGLSSHWST
jgi:hypothetical protein